MCPARRCHSFSPCLSSGWLTPRWNLLLPRYFLDFSPFYFSSLSSLFPVLLLVLFLLTLNSSSFPSSFSSLCFSCLFFFFFSLPHSDSANRVALKHGNVPRKRAALPSCMSRLCVCPPTKCTILHRLLVSSSSSRRVSGCLLVLLQINNALKKKKMAGLFSESVGEMWILIRTGYFHFIIFDPADWVEELTLKIWTVCGL